MKKLLLLVGLVLICYTGFSQVGIGTTNPNATLDIRATNTTIGLNTDGILIPRVDDFPLVADNPGANQDGMLVFATGNGTPTKGFYFWNNTTSNWDKIKTGGNNNIPFVTRTELDAITTPEDGQLVYNSTNDVTLMWNGSNWIVLSNDCFPQPTIANAGVNQNYTDATISTTLAANTPVEGTGLWTIISGAGGSFTDASNPSSGFNGASCETYNLRWTITSACGLSNDDTVITFNQVPTNSNAGPDQYYTDATTSVTLAANTPTIGTGTWSVVSGAGGSFADATNPTTTFTGNLCTNYSLRWEVTACTTSSDYTTISFQEAPTTANAGPNQNFTDNVTTSTTLAANTPTAGTGVWSVATGTGGSFADATDPTTTFTGNLCTIYNLRWTITNCSSQSSDVVNVRFFAGTIPSNGANAGSDIYSLSNTTVTLTAATPTIGSGAWSIVSGSGTFADTTDPTTTFTGSNNTRHILRWTVTGCNGSRTDDVNVHLGIVVGQNAYGGVIFYVDGTGTGGLVVSTIPQGSIRWTCTNTNIIGATGTAIGTGNSNTVAIVDGSCGATPYAANTCRGLSLNGFSDWFLPSLNELLELRNRRIIVNEAIGTIGGSQINSSLHWSSTQASTNLARSVNMSSGGVLNTSKTNSLSVRAIRAF